MIRSRLVWFKHVLGAVAALLLLLCAAEVGLRVYDSCSREQAWQASSENVLPAGAGWNPGDAGLLARSWLTHHRLRPLQRAPVRNPDTGARVEIATNSFGLRGPEPAVPKPPGVYRIVCLGDETVFAPDLDEAETFCARLRELLAPRTRFEVEVVNAGVPGYCPLLSFLQVRHLLAALQPDLLVLSFDMNDIADDYRYRRHTRMAGDALPLACPHPELERRRPIAAEGAANPFLLVRWARGQLGLIPGADTRTTDRRDIDAPEGRYAWIRDDPPDWSVYVDQALSPIAHLGHAADHLYARLVVAAHPAPWQVAEDASSGDGVREAAGILPNALYGSRAPFDALAAWLARRQILFCDASPAFQAAPDGGRLFLHNAPRMSAEGHELYARELASYLLRHVPDVWLQDSYVPGSPERREPPARHAFLTLE